MHERRTLPAVVITAVLLATMLAIVAELPAAAGTSPSPYVVTVTNDELDPNPGADPDDLSLREAVQLASSDFDSSAIVLSRQATYELTRCGPAGSQEDLGVDGDLDVNQGQNLAIQGAGATIHQTCPGERVLEFWPDAAFLTIREVALTGGHAIGRGGAINLPGGDPTLQADGIAVRGNRATEGGGGIYASRGEAVVEDSTISDNVTEAGRGGGIWAQSGILDVARSTVSHNVGDEEGGGVAGHDVSVAGSTVVANALVGDGPRAGSNLHADMGALVRDSVFAYGVGASDCSGALPVFDNLDSDGTCTDAPDGPRRGVHPQLGPLAANGGGTETHRPAVGSPVFDVDPAPCFGPLDQRGEARPEAPDGACDLGSVEAPAASCTPPGFSDVGTKHRFFDDVCWMDQMGITTGFADGTYRPSAPVTRQSMAAFLYRFALSPPFDPPAAPTFPDVGAASPFFAEVEWLSTTGIAQGFGDGTFRPSAQVSRQAMSAFLFRISGDVGYVAPETSSFSDVGLGHPFFAPIHWAATHARVSEGYGDGTWRPSAPVTRQAMSAFLHRLAAVPSLDGI